jgi:hypothetical protein
MRQNAGCLRHTRWSTITNELLLALVTKVFDRELAEPRV